MKPRGDRIVSATRMARQERELRRITEAAIAEYLDAVAQAVEPTSIRASADPDDVNLNGLDQSALWPAIVQGRIAPYLGELLDAVAPPARYPLSPAAAKSLADWRAEWLRARTVALANVPTEITASIREAVASSVVEHGPDPRRAAAIVREKLGPDAWRGRAQTIARTEVVGANNQASIRSWQAVHDTIAPHGGRVYKTWLATGGPGSREDHNDVDGTEIPIGDQFIVGGEPMNGPGDENASAENLINCRCTTTTRVEEADGGSDDASMAASAALVAAPVVTEPAPDINGEPITGAAVLLMVSADDAARLAVDGGEPPDAMHVTLGYLKDKPDDLDPEVLPMLLDALAPLADSVPLAGDAFATATFNADSDERETCQVVLVQSAELAQIHDDVSAALGGLASTTFPVWIPHVTRAYAEEAPASDGVLGPVTFDRLVLGWAGTNYVITNPAGELPDSPPPAGDAPTSDQNPTEEPAVTAAGEGSAAVTAPTETPPSDAAATPADGAQWQGPLIEVDKLTADHRILLSAGAVIRPLPLPLSYQREGSHGGEESGTKVLVGRITACEIRDGVLWGEGDWLSTDLCYEAMEAMERVAAGLGMVSGDYAPSVVEIGAQQPDGSIVAVDPMMYDGDPNDLAEVAVEWQFMGATLVIDPAFDGTRITAVEGAPTVGPEVVEDPAAPVLVPAMIAAGEPHRYASAWFQPQPLDGPTALTITDEGRVFGHLATFGTCHTSFPDACVTAPRSGADYAYFHLGEVDTDAGSLAVGKLTVGGGHADVKAGWRGAAEHYDNAGAAVAVVRAYEDEHGIQVAGALVANAAPEQIAALKRSPLSGDWRRIGGNLELVGALSVNVPGFPVPRAALAASGAQLSLVAAGVLPVAEEEDRAAAGWSLNPALLAAAMDEADRKRARRNELRGRLRAQRRDELLAKVGAQ